MELSGKIVQILAKQTGEGKNGTWEKQDYIIETQGQYPKKVCFSVWGAKISSSNIQMGEFINIGMDIESREYNGRWYTDIRAWKVDRPGANNGSNGGSPSNSSNQNANDPFENTENISDPFAPSANAEMDDLPF
jgi:hypothetical protein